MRFVPRSEMPDDKLSGRGIVVLAASLSLAVIGLDHFLRTPPGQFSRQPATEIAHWITDSMMALPLFAIGVLAADWVAGRARIGMDRRAAHVLKRALLVTAACAVVVAPAWFQVDRTDNPVTAQPLVFPHASDSGDVYWVAPAVIVALTCACLVPLAAWAGHGAGRGAGRGLIRVMAIAILVAAMPAAAWLLHQAAERAYASRVYQTRAPLPVPPRPHAAHLSLPRPPTPGPSTAAAPDAFAYQAAHALQDGLAGQAAGLPVAITVLLWGGPALRQTSRRTTVPNSVRYPQEDL